MEEIIERLDAIEKSIEYQTKLIESLLLTFDERSSSAKASAEARMKNLKSVFMNLPGIGSNPELNQLFDSIFTIS